MFYFPPAASHISLSTIKYRAIAEEEGAALFAVVDAATVVGVAAAGG